MEKQKEEIQKLYESGILTKEEMEAELKKVAKPTSNKSSNKLWWIGCGLVIVVAGLWVALAFNRNKVGNSAEGDDSFGESPSWEVVNIDGAPAVQTLFHNQNYGNLQVAYSPSFGIRFGLFDSAMQQIPITSGTAGFSRVVTKEEVDADYEIMKANGMADEEYYRMYLDQVGTLKSNLIAFPSYKNGFIYFTNEIADKFFNLMDKGAAKSLLLTHFVETTEETDYPERLEYEWFTKFKPGELSALIRDIN